MSSIQRRFGLLLGAAMAVMAFTSVSALAAPVDFPHETAKSKWSGVEVYDWNGSVGNSYGCGDPAGVCSFSDKGKFRTKAELFGAIGDTGNSECTLQGDIISTSGEVEITNSSCLAKTANGTGQICYHKFAEEFWVRLPFNFSAATQIYGHLTLDPSGLKTSVPTFYPRGFSFGSPDEQIMTSFNYTSAGKESPAYFYGKFDEMWKETPLLIGNNPSAGCSWSELS